MPATLPLFYRVILYLQDPMLVARFQERFGIKRLSAAGEGRGCDSASNETRVRYSTHCAASTVKYVVTNRFWHAVFLLGNALGDEVFYISFLPLWFWNVDGAVGRRTVLVWLAVMYIGQAMKDVLCIPRPRCPPAVRVTKKWALEYGFPSTHSMVVVALPGALLIFTHNRYQYSFPLAFVGALAWCLCVCGSRLYLGMHSVLDVVGGVALGGCVLAVLAPYADDIDDLLLRHQHAPLLFSAFIVLLVLFYPSPSAPNTTNTTTTTTTVDNNDAEHRGSARSDTVVICGVVLGFYCGAWLNFSQRLIGPPPLPPPHAVMWPASGRMAALMVARSCVGMAVVLATRAVCKNASSVVARRVAPSPTSETSVSGKAHGRHGSMRHVAVAVDLCCKFVTYVLVGFVIIYAAPLLFRLLAIERPQFYTEI